MLSFSLSCTGYIASDNQREWAVASALPKLVDARDRAVEEALECLPCPCPHADRGCAEDLIVATRAAHARRVRSARATFTKKHTNDRKSHSG